MRFIDVDKEAIRKNSCKITDDFYRYKLGKPVDILSMKNIHRNNFVAKNLSSDAKEDKLMIKYSPTNYVYFTKSFLFGNTDKNLASILIDDKSNSVIIGEHEEFEISNGVLVLSGFLSANNKICADRVIYSNSRITETLLKRVRVLSIGLVDDNLLGMYYIPSERGIFLGTDAKSSRGLSMVTLKEKDCTRYNSFTITDWLDGARITVRDEPAIVLD